MFEREETRFLLKKRRKRLPPIEEIVLDDLNDLTSIPSFFDSQKR
jgi:hypothetical protein